MEVLRWSACIDSDRTVREVARELSVLESSLSTGIRNERRWIEVLFGTSNGPLSTAERVPPQRWFWRASGKTLTPSPFRPLSAHQGPSEHSRQSCRTWLPSAASNPPWAPRQRNPDRLRQSGTQRPHLCTQVRNVTLGTGPGRFETAGQPGNEGGDRARVEAARPSTAQGQLETLRAVQRVHTVAFEDAPRWQEPPRPPSSRGARVSLHR